MVTTFNKILNRNPLQAVLVFTVILLKSLFLSKWKKASTSFEHLHSGTHILFHNYGVNSVLAGPVGIRRSTAQCICYHGDPADRIGFQQAHPREALEDMIKYYSPVCLLSLIYSTRETCNNTIFLFWIICHWSSIVSSREIFTVSIFPFLNLLL